MSTTRKLHIPNLTPTVELFGDWDRAYLLVSGLDNAIKIGYSLAELSAAKKIKQIVRRNIRMNGGKTYWEPVSDQYAEYKSRLGYDPTDLLVMTGLYYNSISIWKIGNATFIGLKGRTRSSGGDLTLQQIASVLEHGSVVRNIPARPLWGPAWKEFGGRARLKGLIIWHIRNQINIRFGVKAKVTF